MKRLQVINLKIKIIAVISLVTVAIGAILYWPSKADAAWFDDNYAYRQPFSFTHNAAISSERSITFSLDTAELITAGVMQSDCDDIRFTDFNGKILKYQLTGSCNNAATTYEVVFPSIINGTNTGYVYYGNPTATAASQTVTATALTPSGGDPAITTRTSEEKSPSSALYLPFDETTGSSTNDASANNNDGSISGSEWRTSDQCVSGSCLYFDGSNDVVTVTNASTIDLDAQLAGALTISTWVRANSDGEGSVGQAVQKGTNTYIRITNEGSDGLADLEVSLDLATTDATVTITDGVKLNSWQHIAVTYTDDADDEITVYIDGKSRGTSTNGSGAPATDANNLLIGGTTTANFHGMIDEVKVFNAEKSETQIKNLSSKGGFDKGVSAVMGKEDTTVLTNGLVGWWRMNETSAWTIDCSTESVLDSSGNANDGAACPNTTGPNGTDTGKFGFANIFDGTNDYVSIADNTNLKPTNVTVSAWVNFSALSGNTTSGGASSGEMYLINKINSADQEGYTVYKGTDNKIYFITRNGGTSDSATSTTTMTTSTWYHIVGTFDGSNLRLYINGNLEATTAHSVALDYGSTALYLGRSGFASGYDGYYSGTMDDVRIYNRALSGKEVETLNSYAPGPIGYWKLDEGTGTSIADASGNGTTLTSTNTSWITGKFGRAFDISSSNEVGAVDPNTLDLGTKNITMTAWVYRDTDTSDNNIIGKRQTGLGTTCGSASDTGYQLITYSTDETSLAICDGTTGYEVYATAGTVGTGTWTHVAAVIDRQNSENRKVYINGVNRTAGTFGSMPSGSISSSNDFHLGAQGNAASPSNQWDGRIDEVKIYDYARSAKQILEDLNAGHPVVGTPVSGPAAHWSFDEGYGTTANDKSINSNSLTLSTASWTNEGRYNKAWNGTGALWVSRANDADLDFGASDDFTLTGWFKSDSATNPTNGVEYILATTTGNTDRGYAIYANTNGTICFGIDDDTTWGPDVSSCTTADYYDAQWHQFTAVRNVSTDTTKLYIDAIEKDSDTDTTTATLDGDNVFYLGDFDGDNNATAGIEEFSGDLDEVKVYRAALSNSDVLVEYNQGKSLVLGSLSTAADGQTATNSAERSYCVPGDTSTCNAPVAEWKFDEGSSTSAFDSSTNGVTGTLTGNATWRTGKLGKGVFVDGTSDYVSMGSNVNMTNSDAFSISLWFYPTAATNNNTYLIAKGATGSSARYDLEWYSTTSGGNACLTVRDATNSYVTCTADNTVDTFNRWYHIVGVYDNASTAGSTIYLDGVDAEFAGYETGNPTTVGSPTNTAGLCIGTEGAASGTCGTSSEFTGIIDNVRIYRYARTAAQVAWEYNNGRPIGWWKFDECSGSTINDSAVTANGAAGGRNGTFYFGANTYTSAGTCSSGTSSHMWNAGTTGKYSSAGAFDGGVSADGDTHVRLPNDTFDSLSQGTVALWFKPSNTGDDVQYLFFAAEDDNGTGSDYFGLLTQNSTQSVAAYIRNNAGDAVVAGSGLSSYTSWHHLAYAVNSSGNKMYIDGKQISPTYSVGSASSTEFFDDIAENTTAYTLGCTNTDGSDTNDCTGVTLMYEGLMDDVRVYPYALTAAQIRTVYNENAAARFGPETGSP